MSVEVNKSTCVRRKDCRLCNGLNHHLILSLEPSPLADSYYPMNVDKRKQELYPMDLFLCDQCGHSQILDVVDAESIYRDYIYVTTSSLGLSTHFKEYADWALSKAKCLEGSLVVDVGSNDGTLLSHFKAGGMKVLGVEPAVEIANNATKVGIQTLPDFFTKDFAGKIRSKYGPASIITMNNLFANIDNLQDAVNGVKLLLAPDGVFIFETFYFVNYVENMVFDFMYHEHLSYNTIKPLVRFFDMHHLELIDVHGVPTKGGSIRCIVQLKGGPRKVTSSVQNYIDYEEKIGIQKPGKLFREYKQKIQSEKEKLRAELDLLKSQGKKIAAFGASATSTTLIYHFGLVPYFDFLIDENPAKQDTFSPGANLPVYSPSSIMLQKPDAIVILAWRFAEPIMKNYSSFLEMGGEFIIPLPSLKKVCGVKNSKS